MLVETPILELRLGDPNQVLRVRQMAGGRSNEMPRLAILHELVLSSPNVEKTGAETVAWKRVYEAEQARKVAELMPCFQ